MSQADKLYRNYFLEYASYVVRDRAIPDLVDGFKPVQRRIMHTLFEMDDGRMMKVANVVGATMKYHPHRERWKLREFPYRGWCCGCQVY